MGSPTAPTAPATRRRRAGWCRGRSGSSRTATRAPPAASPPRTVVLIHGTSRADKLWPQQSWIELGQRLADEGFAVALPQSSSEEGKRARAIAAAIGGDSTVWPQLDLAAFIDRLAATDGAIGIDS